MSNATKIKIKQNQQFHDTENIKSGVKDKVGVSEHAKIYFASLTNANFDALYK